jgi:hypothetical protein
MSFNFYSTDSELSADSESSDYSETSEYESPFSTICRQRSDESISYVNNPRMSIVNNDVLDLMNDFNTMDTTTTRNLDLPSVSNVSYRYTDDELSRQRLLLNNERRLIDELFGSTSESSENYRDESDDMTNEVINRHVEDMKELIYNELFDEFKEYIEEGDGTTYINAKDKSGRTPIFYILKYVESAEEQFKWLHLVLDNGADVTVQDYEGYTLLNFHSPLDDIHFDVIKFLIENGADPLKSRRPPLLQKICTRYVYSPSHKILEFIKWLCPFFEGHHKILNENVDNGLNGPIDILCTYPESEEIYEIIKILLDYGVKPNTFDISDNFLIRIIQNSVQPLPNKLWNLFDNRGFIRDDMKLLSFIREDLGRLLYINNMLYFYPNFDSSHIKFLIHHIRYWVKERVEYRSVTFDTLDFMHEEFNIACDYRNLTSFSHIMRSVFCFYFSRHAYDLSLSLKNINCKYINVYFKMLIDIYDAFTAVKQKKQLYLQDLQISVDNHYFHPDSLLSLCLQNNHKLNEFIKDSEYSRQISIICRLLDVDLKDAKVLGNKIKEWIQYHRTK